MGGQNRAGVWAPGAHQVRAFLNMGLKWCSESRRGRGDGDTDLSQRGDTFLLALRLFCLVTWCLWWVNVRHVHRFTCVFVWACIHTCSVTYNSHCKWFRTYGSREPAFGLWSSPRHRPPGFAFCKWSVTHKSSDTLDPRHPLHSLSHFVITLLLYHCLLGTVS